MNTTHRAALIFLIVFTVASVGCSFTANEKSSKRYRGFIGTTVYARKPIWLYVNENGQLGKGSGYAIESYPTYGNDGLVGILPAGHPVIFTKAYRTFDIGGGGVWLEGSTHFRGTDYPIQFSLSLASDDLNPKLLCESFRKP